MNALEEFVGRCLEVMASHLVAEAILATLGALIIVRIWNPLKHQLAARKWCARAIDVGIRNFYPDRESYARDRPLLFAPYLQSTKHSLRYVGHWLAFTIEQHQMMKTLCEIANSGRKVHLVLLNPEIPANILETYARYFGEDEKSLRSEIRNTWESVRAEWRSLSAQGKECMDLRMHCEFIPYSAFWFDRDHSYGHILIDMKIYGATRKDAYGIELHSASGVQSSYPSLFKRYATSLALLETRSFKDASSSS